VEKQYVLRIPRVCVCSLRYPVWHAHAPCCHVCPLRLYYIFLQYLITSTIFRKEIKFLNMKCVFWVSLQLLYETPSILRRTERDMIKNVYWSACRVPVILVRFWWKLEYSRQSFEKYSSIKFHENPSRGIRVVPYGRTNGHDRDNSHFTKFCERAFRLPGFVTIIDGQCGNILVIALKRLFL